MLERFTGADGRNLAVDALRDQSIIGEGADLAEIVYDHAVIVGFSTDSTIIEASAPENDIFFILAGTVSIRVFGRETAVRTAGQHIGEMAVVDPGQPRSASAVSEDEVVAARVPATAFTKLAEANPRLWWNIARVLAERLRQRNRLVSPLNPRPVLFVGCSSESLPIAHAIQSALDHDPTLVKVWTDDTFQASSFPIESLERELQHIDFAALVLSPDDVIVSRDTTRGAPRDNVIFELGLFMGALGHSRTFLVYPRDVDIKIPTDLMGITPLTYDSSSLCEPAAALAPACNKMRNIIRAGGSR